MNNDILKINNSEITTLNLVIGFMAGVIAFGFFSIFFIVLQTINYFDSKALIFLTVILCLAVLFTFFCIKRVTRREGIKFDFSNNRFSLFKDCIFRKNGDWKELDDYSSLVILIKPGKKTYGDPELQAFESAPMYVYGKINELYLMKSNHVQRVFIVNYKKIAKVKKLAEKIQESSHLKIETYSPVTSRNRRR